MSVFLEELADLIQNCEVGGVSGGTGEYDSQNDIEVDLALNKVDSLGENARKMLEIGILQDELVELGFKPINSHMYQYDNVTKNGKWMWLDFTIGIMYHNNRDTPIDLTNPKDVLTKIKELINEAN